MPKNLDVWVAGNGPVLVFLSAAGEHSFRSVREDYPYFYASLAPLDVGEFATPLRRIASELVSSFTQPVEGAINYRRTIGFYSSGILDVLAETSLEEGRADRTALALASIPLPQKADLLREELKRSTSVSIPLKAELLVEELNHAQFGRLSTMTLPVQVWHRTATRSANGFAYEDTTYTQTQGGSPGSRFSAELSSEFTQVLVIVDLNKTRALRVDQIADYVAVLSLSQPLSLVDCNELPSILDLLSPSCGTRPAPDGVTEVDIAYLTALYTINIEDFAWLQRSQLSGQMSRFIEANQPH